MKKKIGVIGSGISGIVSAFLLDKKYDVTLIEGDYRLGGHTNTISVDDQVLGSIGIDTGFIVFNLQNYPLFTKFLNQLDVSYQDSDMSFGLWDLQQKFWYSSDFPKGVFSDYKNIFSPTFWCFLKEIKSFNKKVLKDLECCAMGSLRLGEYLDIQGYTSFFKHSYLLPMGAAIWSCPTEHILKFPAHSFFSFWKNHSLLTLGKRPVWKTVSKGSQTYISKFLNQFQGTVLKGSPVISIEETQDEVEVTLKNHRKFKFDYVVVATHADQALSLLKKPTDNQKKLLSSWQYSKNQVCLHTDISVMPPKRSAWASWLVQNSNDRNLVMTYYMNRLQKFHSPVDYFVTLNHFGSISKDKIIKIINYKHPVYDQRSLDSQKELPKLNKGPIFFCGSYFGYGFHEDGVKSAVDACQHLGVEL